MVDIGFNYVPSNQRIPGIYPEVEGDIPGQPPQWSLLIGQAVSGPASALPGSPILISSVSAAVRHFGAGSMIASMVERYLGADPNGTLWVLALPEPTTGMLAAKGSINFTGTATAAGAINLYIAGRYVGVTVNIGDTGAIIAGNVATAITNYFDANQLGLKAKNRQFLGVKMPVNAVVDTTTNTKVDLTCTFKGTAGNKIDVQLNYYGTSGREELPAGITAVVAAMGADQLGTGDPDTGGLDAVLTDTKYDFIIQPWATNPDVHGNSAPAQSLTDFQTLMADDTGRWSPQRKVYGHVFSAASFPTNGTDAVNFGSTRNDRHMTIVGFEQSLPMPPYDVAAAYAGAFAASSRVDPARPTQTLPVVGILAPHRSARFSAATRQTLLGVGLALMDYEPDYTCRILRAVTTYQLDENGSPDISYRDTETLYTLMAVVRQMTADWGAAYPRAKIVDDDVAFGPGNSFAAGLPDQPVVTTKSGKAVLVASYSRMANGNSQSIWVTDTDSFAGNLILQRNGLDPTRLDALLPIVLASGLRVTAMKIDFALQAAA